MGRAYQILLWSSMVSHILSVILLQVALQTQNGWLHAMFPLHYSFIVFLQLAELIEQPIRIQHEKVSSFLRMWGAVRVRSYLEAFFWQYFRAVLYGRP